MQATQKLLNIDKRNKEAVTLFSPYPGPSILRQSYRSSARQDQSRHSKSSDRMGKNTQRRARLESRVR